MEEAARREAEEDERDRQRKLALTERKIKMLKDNSRLMEEKRTLREQLRKEEEEYAEQYRREGEAYALQQKNSYLNRRSQMSEYGKLLEDQIREHQRKMKTVDMTDEEKRMNKDALERLKSDRELARKIKAKLVMHGTPTEAS